ncbi:Uncharacterised protein [Mycobacterium tuberculosis]|uniref:Uncharacterized protein n=1 Tax=Mycobacterium tuberculosis TaxID=1773 RepID=A0A0U0S7Y7_MYCTX|nr:Uncharacterised protein [Mycobacterium tuberculosis]
MHELLGDGARRTGAPQCLFAAAGGFFVAAALLHRYTVYLDQFVDHVGGRRARPGDQRRAHAVAVDGFTAQRGDAELVKVAGHHDARPGGS